MKDTAEKAYLSNPVTFADLVNAVLFDGEQRVHSEDLQELDSTETFHDMINTELLSQQKWRDILKRAAVKQADGCCYVVIGAENQTEQNNALAVRDMLYDAIHYASQVRQLDREHRNQGHRAENPAEFLSGFRSGDRLMPVVTVVVYWGPEKWTAPRSLHEMFGLGVPEEILRHVPDYRITILAPGEMEDLSVFRTDLKQVLRAVQVENDLDALRKLLTEDPSFRSVDHDAAVTIQTLTKMSLRIPPGKEAVNMCKAAEEWKEELLTQGRAEGEIKGRAEGMEEGQARTTLMVYRNCLNRGMSQQDAIEISGISKELLSTIAE